MSADQRLNNESSDGFPSRINSSKRVLIRAISHQWTVLTHRILAAPAPAVALRACRWYRWRPSFLRVSFDAGCVQRTQYQDLNVLDEDNNMMPTSIRCLAPLHLSFFTSISLVLLTGCWSNPPESFVLDVEPETTHIVSPLDSENFIDYIGAGNARLSDDVDPEDNWEVVIRRAFGPLGWDEASDAKYYRRLGIPPVPAIPELGSYFQPLAGLGPNVPEAHKKRQQQFWDIEGPWRAEDYPESAEWLRMQSEIWDRLEAGSHVSRYYIPRVMSAEAHAAKVGTLNAFFSAAGKSSDSSERAAAAVAQALVGGFRTEVAPLSRWHVNEMTQQTREFGRVLKIRFYLRLGEGDIPAAQSDLLAIHRIARLSSQGMLTEWMLGIALEYMALHGDAALLASGKMPQEACASHLAKLSQLPPLVEAKEQLELACRPIGLDALQFSARRHQEAYELLQSEGASRSLRSAFAKIDWNQAMRIFNRRCDELDAAMQHTDAVERIKRAAQAGPQSRSHKDQELLEEMQQAAEETGDLTEFMAEFYFDRHMFNLAKTESRHQAYLEVVRTAYASYLHRFDHGSFPTTLEALLPTLKELPIDPFSGKPIRLTINDGDFVVYSIGDNQKDDGGLNWDDKEWDKDDLRVRLPPDAEP